MKNCSTMRLVEAVERAQPVDVGLAGARRQHHGDRVARRDADHHEHHHRHAEQRDGHGEQADEEALQDHLDSRSQCSFGRAELPLSPYPLPIRTGRGAPALRPVLLSPFLRGEDAGRQVRGSATAGLSSYVKPASSAPAAARPTCAARPSRSSHARSAAHTGSAAAHRPRRRSACRRPSSRRCAWPRPARPTAG